MKKHRLLGCLTLCGALSPASPIQGWAAVAPAAATNETRLLEGQTVYAEHCSACHGSNGDGRGPAAAWLYPKPRNFSAGLFKIQSTPAAFLPTDEDLYRSVTRGLPGSGMPSFNYLSDQARRDVVAYVKHLTAYVDEQGRRINRFAAAQAKGAVGQPVQVPPEPPATLQSLVLGKDMFVKMQCGGCHGETGAGDGPQVPSLKDTFGVPARPRDFNTGAFRGGHTGRDLYLRIHNGLAGTPMVPYGPDVLTPEQRWAVAHYVLSLRRKDIEVSDMLAPEDSLVAAHRVEQLPTEPEDPFWESLDPVRVPLNPLWPEPYPVPAMTVRAVHDGARMALLCQWRDEIANGAPVRVQDFQDAVALQFALRGTPPFLGMGDAHNPVNLWQWKAGWQAEMEGRRLDMHDRYPSLHVDTYFATSYRTAVEAGNIVAQPHQSPVEDANARGFGSITSQPLARQNVQGKGIWHDGFWNVVFLRSLKSDDAEDVPLAPSQAVPVAFAVWNGEQHDRNGRKVISNWYQLVLDP